MKCNGWRILFLLCSIGTNSGNLLNFHFYFIMLCKYRLGKFPSHKIQCLNAVQLCRSLIKCVNYVNSVNFLKLENILNMASAFGVSFWFLLDWIIAKTMSHTHTQTRARAIDCIELAEMAINKWQIKCHTFLSEEYRIPWHETPTSLADINFIFVLCIAHTDKPSQAKRYLLLLTQMNSYEMYTPLWVADYQHQFHFRFVFHFRVV